jgi:hypothetical protein
MQQKWIVSWRVNELCQLGSQFRIGLANQKNLLTSDPRGDIETCLT